MNAYYDLEKHLADTYNTITHMKVPFFGYGDQDKLHHQIDLIRQELRNFELAYKSVKCTYEDMKVGYDDYCEKVKELREELSVLEAETFERTHQGLLNYIDGMTQEELIRVRTLIKVKLNSAYGDLDNRNLYSSPRTESRNMSSTNHHNPTSSNYAVSSSCSSSSSFDGGSCGGGGF